MDKWEYKTITLSVKGHSSEVVNAGELDEALNALGAEGWGWPWPCIRSSTMPVRGNSCTLSNAAPVDADRPGRYRL